MTEEEALRVVAMEIMDHPERYTADGRSIRRACDSVLVCSQRLSKDSILAIGLKIVDDHGVIILNPAVPLDSEEAQIIEGFLFDIKNNRRYKAMKRIYGDRVERGATSDNSGAD